MDEKKISLKLKHISQSYIVDNKVFDAVVDVSLDVYKSEFLVVLGPGRCGKTVLLNMIAGLEKPVLLSERNSRTKIGMKPHRLS